MLTMLSVVVVLLVAGYIINTRLQKSQTKTSQPTPTEPVKVTVSEEVVTGLTDQKIDEVAAVVEGVEAVVPETKVEVVVETTAKKPAARKSSARKPAAKKAPAKKPAAKK